MNYRTRLHTRKYAQQRKQDHQEQYFDYNFDTKLIANDGSNVDGWVSICLLAFLFIMIIEMCRIIAN